MNGGKDMDLVEKYFMNKYTICFVIGPFLFLIVWNIIQGVVNTPSAITGASHSYSSKLELYGILFMILYGSALIVLFVIEKRMINKGGLNSDTRKDIQK